MIVELICFIFVALLLAGQIRIWRHRKDPKPLFEAGLLSEDGLEGIPLAQVRNRNAMIRGRSLGFKQYTINCVNPNCPFRVEKKVYEVEEYFKRKTPMPPCRSDCPGWPNLTL